MIEIIALIFLTKQIGKLAADKGLKPGKWKVYLVLAWIAGEFVGVAAGMLLFGPDNIFSVLLVGIAGAVTGYFIIRDNLSKRPDVFDEIDQVGNNSGY